VSITNVYNSFPFSAAGENLENYGGLKPDFFHFSAPQAKILRIMEVLKSDFFHFSAPQAKFFEV